MKLTEDEKKLLAKLITLDAGDMAGAHWPIAMLLKGLDVETEDAEQLAKELEEKKLVSIQGGTPCLCITPDGRKAIETSL
ncbi:MAG: hypothetical protein HQ568_05440 [Calditrichaeota bacterium]|nr:hypothetical protein [Calditrichota bacterium]